jgi:hypothetical protein
LKFRPTVAIHGKIPVYHEYIIENSSRIGVLRVNGGK